MLNARCASQRDDQEDSHRTSHRTKPLIFEHQLAGQEGLSAAGARCSCGRRRRRARRRQCARRDRRLPEVSEVEVIRHFTRLSTWNYAIDLGMYPLGLLHDEVQPARSMKLVARLEGSPWAHPYQPEALSQGAMEVMAKLEHCLAEITGWMRSHCSPRPARTAK